MSPLAPALPRDALGRDRRAPRPALLGVSREALRGGARLGMRPARFARRGAGALEPQGQLFARNEAGHRRLGLGLALGRFVAGGLGALGRLLLRRAAGDDLGALALIRPERVAGGVGGGAGGADAVAPLGLGGGGLAQRLGRPGRVGAHDFGRLARGLGLALEIAEPVLFGEPARGRGRRLGGGDKAVPAPQVALARDEPLADFEIGGQAVAGVARNHPDLGEAARQGGRRRDPRRERLDAVGQRRIGPETGHQRPVDGGRLVGRRVEVVAERRPERRLVAARDADRIDDRSETVVGAGADEPRQGSRLRLQRLRLALGLGERGAGGGLLVARLRLALLGERRRLLGRVQRLGKLGGGLGAAFVLGLGEAVGVERLEIARDGGVFGLEPGETAALLGGGGAERVAARIKVGRGGLRLIELGLGGGERAGRRLLPDARLGRDVAGAVKRLGEARVLGLEPRQDRGGVGDQRLFALEVAGELRRAPLELGLAPGRALFLRLEGLAGDGDALQRRGAARLLVAQARQFGCGQRLQARRLALGAGALGDVEEVGVELLRRLGKGGLGLAPGDEMSQRLVAADVGGKVAVAARLARLALEAVDLGVDLLQHVLDPQQIVLGALEAQLRLVPARMQAGNAGGLFEDQPPRLGLGGDDLADLALADEGGRAGAGRGVGEQKLDVAGAHLPAVDPVGRAGLALDAARHLDRLVLVEGGRGPMVGIVEKDADLGVVARGPSARAREDDVVHARGAHGLERAFAHHPAQRLDEVRLAAAVRADDAGEAGLDLELRGVAEALEAGHAQALEFHGAALSSRGL